MFLWSHRNNLVLFNILGITQIVCKYLCLNRHSYKLWFDISNHSRLPNNLWSYLIKLPNYNHTFISIWSCSWGKKTYQIFTLTTVNPFRKQLIELFPSITNNRLITEDRLKQSVHEENTSHQIWEAWYDLQKRLAMIIQYPDK